MEENTRNTEVIHEITPKFDFIYELGMPTGKKIKSTLFMLLIFGLGYIVYFIGKDKIKSDQLIFGNVDVMNILNVILIIGIIFSIVKLVIHILLQMAQYKNIKYTFYNDHMTYEDSFLNQHKKNIEYANVKEVEIRRSVWDRIMGYGIIVIYTNAENEYSNGLVIFSIKNPKEHYDIIDKLVHSTGTKNPTNTIKEDENIKTSETVAEDNINIGKKDIGQDNESEKETHEEFLESLKHIEK